MNDKPYFEVQTVYMKGNKKVEHTENLNKIKLPFYCYFSLNSGESKHLGIVDWDDGYYLQSHTGQSYDSSGRVGKTDKLLDLIKEFSIETVKVKIIVYN